MRGGGGGGVNSASQNWGGGGAQEKGLCAKHDVVMSRRIHPKDDTAPVSLYNRHKSRSAKFLTINTVARKTTVAPGPRA